MFLERGVKVNCALLAVVALTLRPLAVAQQPIPTPLHTGVLEYQRTQVEVKDNLYHINGYVCTEGSAHYGPDCVPEVATPSFSEKTTLTLDDGRVLSIRGSLVKLAYLEAETRGNKGTWKVAYEFEESRQNPFTGHTIQFVKVVFPVTVGDKIIPVTKHIMFDVSDKFLNASTIEEGNSN
jgi:hypothetical protein